MLKPEAQKVKQKTTLPAAQSEKKADTSLPAERGYDPVASVTTAEKLDSFLRSQLSGDLKEVRIKQRRDQQLIECIEIVLFKMFVSIRYQELKMQTLRF